MGTCTVRMPHWIKWALEGPGRVCDIRSTANSAWDEHEEDEGDDENQPKMVESDLELVRQVFQKGYRDLKNKSLKNKVSRVVFLPKGKEY